MAILVVEFKCKSNPRSFEKSLLKEKLTLLSGQDNWVQSSETETSLVLKSEESCSKKPFEKVVSLLVEDLNIYFRNAAEAVEHDYRIANMDGAIYPVVSFGYLRHQFVKSVLETGSKEKSALIEVNTDWYRSRMENSPFSKFMKLFRS